MKRVFAFLLALAMVLSLSVTAFAAEGVGSITVTNATYGETYAIYHIFDASVKFTKDEQGNDTNTVEGVAYSITTDNQFFALLFQSQPTETDPYNNPFFIYNPNDGSVTKKEVNDTELVNYLTELVAGGNFETASKSILAVEKGKTQEDYDLKYTFDSAKHTIDEGPGISFENLPYGYYLITSTLGTTVTINSNTPEVEVIDKNQEPGTGFNKQVQIGVDENNNPIWADANSANIGDKISYNISFEATNYDGDKLIKYYQVHDEKGDAIWAEFDSFRVFVDGVELPRGYYLSLGGDNTNDWELLGNKTHKDGWDDYEGEKVANNAQWYLVHLGYDEYRVTIPWLEGHTLTETINEAGKTVYQVNFPANAKSKFASPAKVEVRYDAAIEANASIGGTTHGNRFNKANASWTSEHETGNTPPDEVVTKVYGIGLLKDDSATGQNLADAKFEIFGYNEASKKYDRPIYLIPTGVDGVYVVDSKGAYIEGASGTKKAPARDYYYYLRDAQGNILKDNNDQNIVNAALQELGNKQTNEVVTPENGKVVILGLAEGTYHMIETDPPEGYNGMSTPIVFEVNNTTAKPFSIFADKNGNVADIQSESGVFTERRYDVTDSVVHNSKGTILPSTGGEGAIMLITIGTLVAIGFAVLMITQKKMSIYKG